MSQKMKAIEVSGLTQVYRPPFFFKGPTVTALKNINLHVEKETIYTLLGPNGAGKTTLILILSGLMPPTQGEVRLAGIPLKNKKEISKKIGFFMSGTRGFWWFMTGWENLEYFAALQNLVGRPARKRISELIELFGMTSYAKREVYSYSNGMKQRLLLARALLHDPEILLFDEPISHLDPIAAHEFHLLIRDQLCRDLKKTIFLSTHQLEEAQEISDMLGFLFKGELAWQKSGDLFRSKRANLLTEYMETAGKMEIKK